MGDLAAGEHIIDSQRMLPINAVRFPHAHCACRGDQPDILSAHSVNLLLMQAIEVGLCLVEIAVRAR